jgi:hypothetical protein
LHLVAVKDVQKVLQNASLINDFMTRNRLNSQVQKDWATVRTELNELAHACGLSWQSRPTPPVQSSRSPRVSNGKLDQHLGRVDSNGGKKTYPLTGTFRLDASRSDDPRNKIQLATQNLSVNERQNVYDQIMTRLESPAMLAIERRGAIVTIASSLVAQTTFQADGRERREQLGDSRPVRITATLRGEMLVVSSNGYRDNDSDVTFDANGGDRGLLVRRQVYSDRLTKPVVVDSVYDRTDDLPLWTVYPDSPTVLAKPTTEAVFIVGDGETLVAILNKDLTTKEAKQGDRFTITVRQPSQYEGAVIEGRVRTVNQGSLTGRSLLSLNFDTIRLPNGQASKFGATLKVVRTPNGDTVQIDNGTSTNGDSQPPQTIKPTGTGTAAGAFISLIADGVDAIGAVSDTLRGDSSVYVQGKDHLELPAGTQLTIRATTPM